MPRTRLATANTPSAPASAVALPLALSLAVVGGAVGAITPAAAAEDEVVNVYSSRHYDTDLALYETFTEQTGIEVNLIEAGADALLERLRPRAPTARPICWSPSMPGACGAPPRPACCRRWTATCWTSGFPKSTAPG